MIYLEDGGGEADGGVRVVVRRGGAEEERRGAPAGELVRLELAAGRLTRGRHQQLQVSHHLLEFRPRAGVGECWAHAVEKGGCQASCGARLQAGAFPRPA
jgi:hypothetical protein